TFGSMRNSVNTLEHPAITVAPDGAASSAPQRPEFFRLPKSGGDPHFGFGRSFYYTGEARGYWRLVRIRERGKRRGITLVDYNAVDRFVRSKMESAAK